MKLKPPKKQRTAWQRWASAHPDAAQANRNAWAKSEKGRAWLKKNQKKKNVARKAWRARKKLAGRLPAQTGGSPIPPGKGS